MQQGGLFEIKIFKSNLLFLLSIHTYYMSGGKIPLGAFAQVQDPATGKYNIIIYYYYIVYLQYRYLHERRRILYCIHVTYN